MSKEHNGITDTGIEQTLAANGKSKMVTIEDDGSQGDIGAWARINRYLSANMTLGWQVYTMSYKGGDDGKFFGAILVRE